MKLASISGTKHLCFECRACEQICPRGAITFEENQEGFSYPIVDTAKCINCGKCLKVCPAINAEKTKQKCHFVYAAQAKDVECLMNSSSGGVFTVIAKYVIDQGGVVFGASWNHNFQLRHIAVTSQDSLDKLRGSKYVHSDVGDSYKIVRELLIQNRLVYYTGTPCQIAGLKLFLGREYSNLITSDLICHGTPSQKLFNLIISHIESEQGIEIIEYNFRDKTIFGWSTSSSYIFQKNSIDNNYQYYDKNMIAYFQAFIKGHVAREDCYCCPFACVNRVGDITLADYWEVGKHHSDFSNIHKGVSLILSNSDKGDSILNAIKHNLLIQKSTLEFALDTCNRNLKKPTIRPNERFSSYSFAFNDYKAFRDYYASFAPSKKYYRRCYWRYIIKNILKNILFLR